MKNDPVYTGPFRDLIPRFIQFKRSQGYDYGKTIVMRLREIDLFMQSAGVSQHVITEEMHEKWCARRNGELPSNQAKRTSALAVFEKWMAEQLHMTGIYVDREFKCRRFHSNFIPYIFSEADIVAMFDVTGCECGSKVFLHNMRTLAPMLALYYGCGLRKSEAQRLLMRDVDLETGKIRILDSKNHVSRIVIVSNSILRRLAKYKDTSPGKRNDGDLFFHKLNGGYFGDGIIHPLFHDVMDKAGIRRPDNGRHPRIHDLRHTYAIRALEQMERKGFDLYTSLPLLSKCMGHMHITETEYYLKLREEHFSAMLAKVETCSPKLSILNGGGQ